MDMEKIIEAIKAKFGKFWFALLLFAASFVFALLLSIVTTSPVPLAIWASAATLGTFIASIIVAIGTATNWE